MRVWCFNSLVLWIILGFDFAPGATGLPEEKTFRTNCVNSSLERDFTPFCGYEKRIAVESLGYKCMGSPSCIDDTTDSPVRNNILSAAVSQVSGEKSGTYPVTTALCNNDLNTFMKMSYYCIDAAKLAPMCSATKLTSNGTAYLTSNSYPHGTVLGTECKCSVTVSSLNSTTSTPSTVNITMVTIHIELNTGQQLVVTSPAGGMLKNITKHNNAFNISSEQFSFSTLNVLWNNEASNSNGSFWIGFHNFDPSSTVRVACQEPVHISTKPAKLASSGPLFNSFSNTVWPHSTNFSGTNPKFVVSTSVSERISNTLSFSNSTDVRTFANFAVSSRSPFSIDAKTDRTRLDSATEALDRPEENTNLIPMIIEILGSLLILLVIIIIIYVVKKKKQGKVAPANTDLRQQNETKGQANNTDHEKHNVSQVPNLPPIMGLAPISTTHTDITEDKNTKLIGSNEYDMSGKEIKSKKKSRKKKKRTNKVSDVLNNDKGDDDGNTFEQVNSNMTNDINHKIDT